MLAGSQTAKGIYTHNGVNVTEYQGEFEKRIFSKAGNYTQQVLEPYSIRRALPNYSLAKRWQRWRGENAHINVS